MTTWPRPAATGWSTPSWRGATSTPSRPASRPTSTPALTTSASKPSPTGRGMFPTPSGASSHRRSCKRAKVKGSGDGEAAGERAGVAADLGDQELDVVGGDRRQRQCVAGRGDLHRHVLVSEHG